MSLVEQELSGHLSSTPVFSRVRVANFLVVCVVCWNIIVFSFVAICVACPSFIEGF